MEAAVDMNIYQNSPDGQHTQAPACRHHKEYRLYRLIAVSFGILCVLQVALNIYLRLAGRPCPEGWLSYGSCYYISVSHRNWTDSRDQCLKRGADLIIISNQEEQKFVRALSVQAWIGLSYSKKDLVWKWVDGATLTNGTGYWLKGEPNNLKMKENCGETWVREPSLQTWNDNNCDFELPWICERAP
ncbi:CD209 antigen-like protein D isoform X1 [Alosa sapidissima]|uniref:CD209 antigen-like protein D isoform X1 n=1 Tax=Alosa sapidissima TaxID=34773 RepID=UPI001C0A5233|nr:CD209 antigen-like protein D isoform X1 [Alosa sapidissima]